jgi:hypothetical protein
MGTLRGFQMRCREILCITAKRRETITFGNLAKALGLKSARQPWNTALHPLSESETKRSGADLTLIVVYASGPAKGLGRFFSNVRGGAPPRATMLDPRNAEQKAAYKEELERIFDIYEKVDC